MIRVAVAMRLGEVCSTYGADVDIGPDSGGQNVAVARTATVYGQGDFRPVLSLDEIESEEDDDEEKPDEISDDSSNLEDEVPVATKLATGRGRRRNARVKRGDADNVAAGGKKRAKKDAPRDWLLKYLQPNVSNVADRSDYGNAGTGLLIGRESFSPAWQSEVGREYSFSSEEEQEQPPSVSLASEEKPEGTFVVQDEGVEDADVLEFTNLTFSECKDAIKDRRICEKRKKDRAGKAQKTPVIAIIRCSHPSEVSPSFVKTQADVFEISSRKPLAQIHQRDSESAKSDVLERTQMREKLQKENEAPKRRRLSLSKDSRRQLSLKSFINPFPML